MDINVRSANFNFKNGLSLNVIQKVNHADTNVIEKRLMQIYGIDAKFKNFKSIASCVEFTADIFQEAVDKYRLPFEHMPPSVRTFKSQEWIQYTPEDEDTIAFCMDGNERILRHDKVFRPCSIFIKRIYDDIKYINESEEETFKEKISCSAHFLRTFIHEWIHNIHTNKIYKRCGINSDCLQSDSPVNKAFDIIDSYRENRPNFFQRIIINHSLKKYAATNYMELMAEGLTKIIIDSLSSDYPCLIKNPMDNLKKLPSFVQKFIESELG